MICPTSNCPARCNVVAIRNLVDGHGRIGGGAVERVRADDDDFAQPFVLIRAGRLRQFRWKKRRCEARLEHHAHRSASAQFSVAAAD